MLVPLVQEPDSFSQCIVGLLQRAIDLFQLADTGVEPIHLGGMGLLFSGTPRRATTRCSRQETSSPHYLDAESSPVEVPIQHRVAPPPQLPAGQPTLGQPPNPYCP